MSSSAAATVIAAVAAAAAAAAGTNNPVANNRSSQMASIGANAGAASRPNGSAGLSRQIKFHEYKGPPAARRGSTSPAKQQQQQLASAAAKALRQHKAAAGTTFQQQVQPGDSAQQQVVGVQQAQAAPGFQAPPPNSGPGEPASKRSTASKLMFLPASQAAARLTSAATFVSPPSEMSPRNNLQLQQPMSAGASSGQRSAQQLTSGVDLHGSEDGPKTSSLVLVEQQQQQQQRQLGLANGLVGQAQQFHQRAATFGAAVDLNGADVTGGGGGVFERAPSAAALGAQPKDNFGCARAPVTSAASSATTAAPISVLTPISVVMQLHHFHPQQQQPQLQSQSQSQHHSNNHHQSHQQRHTAVENGDARVQVQATISQSASMNANVPQTNLANDHMYRNAKSNSFAATSSFTPIAAPNALPSNVGGNYIGSNIDHRSGGVVSSAVRLRGDFGAAATTTTATTSTSTPPTLTQTTAPTNNGSQTSQQCRVIASVAAINQSHQQNNFALYSNASETPSPTQGAILSAHTISEPVQKQRQQPRNFLQTDTSPAPPPSTATTTTMTPTSQATPTQTAASSLQEARECVAAIVYGPNSEQNTLPAPRHGDATNGSSSAQLGPTMQLNHALDHRPQGAQIVDGDNGCAFVSVNDTRQQQQLQLQMHQQQHAAVMDEIAILHQNCNNQSQVTQFEGDNNNSQFCNNAHAMDSCDQLEPTIGFSNGQFDELLFSEFIDLQDVPMNVDESDWLRKFLPPCSM